MTSRTDTSTSDVTTYAWDAFGRLNSVTLPNTDVVTYKYDGLGRKAVVLLNGTHQYSLLYQDQYQPVAQMDSTGALVARFIWGSRMNVPEYMVKGSDTYRFVTDPRGSVRLVLKVSDGTVAQRIDYDEWGRVTNDTSPGFQPFGYAGGLYDHKTGLVEFGARHYDGEVGRWLSRDPIWFNGGDANLFGYVLNDPVNYVDVNGMRFINLTGNKTVDRVINSPVHSDLRSSKLPIFILPSARGHYFGETIGGSTSAYVYIDFFNNSNTRELANTTHHELMHVNHYFSGNDFSVGNHGNRIRAERDADYFSDRQDGIQCYK